MKDETCLFDFAGLDALFAPRSIAVVGASGQTTRIGGTPLDYLLRFGYGGALHAVNSRPGSVQGLPVHGRLADIGAPVDLAIVAVPQRQVAGVLEDAATAGVRSMVLFSSGYAETGAEGSAAQQALAQRAQTAGMRLVGPNCMGFMRPGHQVYATFLAAPGAGLVKPGRIGLVSQSGAFGTYACSLARERGLGLSLWATTGNEADVQLADALAWLARDPGTDVIMAYLEGCRDGCRLRAALALAQERGKPVILYKAGTSAPGAATASQTASQTASHTTSLAGNDAVYDAVFRRYGVLRAHSISDFFALAASACIAKAPKGRSIALFTASGGVGAMMAGNASAAGLEVAPLSDAAQRQLREWLPFAGPRNPVDVTGQVTTDLTLLQRSAALMLADRHFDSWLGFFAAGGMSDVFWPVLKDLAGTLRARHPDTLLAISTLCPPERRDALEAMGCLVFADPGSAIRCIAALASWRETAVPGAQAATSDGQGALILPPGPQSERRSMALLAEAGIAVVAHRLVRTAREAGQAVQALGASIALKVHGDGISHKSDVGGVALNLADAASAEAAFQRILASARQARPLARIDGALATPMVHGGVECIAGVHRDPVFGPVLMFGLGGIHAEILRDVSLRVLPITRDDAHAMVRELRAFAVLDGARGRPRADLDSLIDTLLALARFAQRAGETLDSAEINPLITRPRADGGCVAVDALVIGRRANARPPA